MIRNIPEAQKYLPDNVRVNSLTRELLINVSKYANNLIIYFYYQIIEVASPQAWSQM